MKPCPFLASVVLALLVPCLASAVEYHAVAASGSNLFVADSDHGLRVFDRSVPAAPVEIASLALPGVTDVAVAGDLACLVDGTGILVVDVSDPASPDLLGSLIPGGSPRSVLLDGSRAYAAGGHELSVIDLTIPGLPSLLGSLTLPLPGGGQILDMARAGSVIYLASYRPVIGVVHSVDVGDPASPDILDDRNVYGAHGITVLGDVAYVTAPSSLTVLDVTNPEILLSHGGVPLRSGAGEVGEGLWFANGNLLVSYRKGVVVFGLGDPTTPVETTAYGTQPGWAWQGTATDGVSYVANGSGGLHILPLATLGTPTGNVSPAGFELVAAAAGWMRLRLPDRASLRVSLCDVTGRERGEVHRAVLGSGEHEIPWDWPSPLPSGIYYLRVTSPWGPVTAPVVRID